MIMKTTSWVELKNIKDWIDGASYAELLAKWHSLPKDSPILNPQYAVSVYYMKAMKTKSGVKKVLDTVALPGVQ